MDEMELKNLGEAARVTEKLADFAGNVVAILTHVEKGKGTLTAAVPEGRAEEFKERLEKGMSLMWRLPIQTRKQRRNPCFLSTGTVTGRRWRRL